MTLSTSKASVGTPSQYAQSSRKGKKAWRKNVDIREVESGLEEIRAEERETGCVKFNLFDDNLSKELNTTVVLRYKRKRIPSCSK